MVGIFVVWFIGRMIVFLVSGSCANVWVGNWLFGWFLFSCLFLWL